METKLIYFYCNVNFENLFFKSVTIIDRFFKGAQLKDYRSEAQKICFLQYLRYSYQD